MKGKKYFKFKAKGEDLIIPVDTIALKVIGFQNFREENNYSGPISNHQVGEFVSMCMVPKSNSIISPKKPTMLRFAERYDNKFRRPIFPTIRGQDKLYEVNKIYHIRLLDKKTKQWLPNGSAKVLRVDWKRICDFSVPEIVEDLGPDFVAKEKGKPICIKTTKRNLLKELEKYYGQKPYWCGKYTLVQKLTCQRFILG